jgi:3-isopropylmalate dehydrogenase
VIKGKTAFKFMQKQIAVLPGDGVGQEVTEQAVKILETITKKFGHEFVFKEAVVGGVAIDKTGSALPDETMKLCLSSDAILFGTIGDPKYDNNPKATIRPEQGILGLRKNLKLHTNIRPIFVFPTLINNSPLKTEIIKNVDFVVIRELVSGIYFGKRGRNKDRTYAFDTAEYSKEEISRVAKFAFEQAEKRKKKLTLVDKANVLETSRLWRETVLDMEKDFPLVTVDYMLVDNAAQQIIKNPGIFDVLLTENMFGDILTDEASVITGSLGMLPSASLGVGTALYEPIHGSFPRATGQNIANPIGSILSAAMMLEYSFGLRKERDAIYNAVEKVLNKGFGTKDLSPKTILGTNELGEKIKETI